ncbi:helix-turn-helix domain-containing protein [Bradyrhizobium sp.]|uniref:winged helix-turn-helix transcriptional regulator n=1 Tax=Bradyrhizobium sp. TaxID=376 RepID=UPI001DF12934|nr:helix-turn-helix domain-containing protein [Bradyrhizobium sp.]MBI5321704.1 helix-turn-helix transcriptional regulator [Bradyrhizobium sp.]
MRRTPFDTMNCSLANALDQIGDWWTLLILREVIIGCDRFDGIQAALGIARNILTVRLTKLVEHGILERQSISPGGKRTAYRLTEKGGELLPALLALMQWGDRWISGKGREPMIATEAATPRRLPRLILRDAKGKPLGAADIRFRPGPGARPATKSHLDRLQRSRKG